jgi:hypothetical protein
VRITPSIRPASRRDDALPTTKARRARGSRCGYRKGHIDTVHPARRGGRQRLSVRHHAAPRPCRGWCRRCFRSSVARAQGRFRERRARRCAAIGVYS